MADVVFILGAGCSMHAGAPNMATFLDHAGDYHRLGEIHTTNYLVPHHDITTENSRSDFDLVFKSIGHLQRVHSKAQLDIRNIESVFAAVEAARLLQKLPGFTDADINAVVRAVQFLIVRTLEHSMKFPRADGSWQATSEYVALARLLGKLSNARPALSTAVITFNYDVGIDVALTKEHIPFTYALDAGDRNQIPLLKLHGSLNWARLEKLKVVRAWPVQHILGFRDPFSSVGALPMPIASVMGRDFRPGDEAIDALPVIVPPTWSKGEHHRELAPVWQRAAQELEGAQYVYIIGYSLPATDQFFQLLFGLGTEGSTPLRSVHVFNPDKSVESRFQSMLGDGAKAVFKYSDVNFKRACADIRSYFAPTFQN